jgi:hypothetical protein
MSCSVRGCIHKFPDWPPGARTANGTAPATRCSCIAILWVGVVSFAAITLCVASQQVFIVVYFVIDSVRKLLDTLSYLQRGTKMSNGTHSRFGLMFHSLEYIVWIEY